MQADIISIQELSDSKEVLLKKIPFSIKASVALILSILATLLIILCFLKIDTYVIASGELRPYMDESSINSNGGGKIIASHHHSGDQVHIGEPLFEFCHENLEKQKNILKNEINKKDHLLLCHNQFLKSIDKNQNLCENDSNQYKQFENYKFEISQLENSETLSCITSQKTLDCEKNKIKSTYILNTQQAIDKLNTEKISLELQLSTILDSIQQSYIVATSDGFLNLSKNLLPGEVIPPNTDIGYIVPNQDKLKVRLFVPEKFISELYVGQDITFKFDSTFLKKHIFGKIYHISPDSTTDQKSMQTYYIVESSISNNEFQKKLRPGMKVSSHIITGKQSVIDYVIKLI